MEFWRQVRNRVYITLKQYINLRTADSREENHALNRDQHIETLRINVISTSVIMRVYTWTKFRHLTTLGTSNYTAT
jgi:hypothetical protein